MANSATQHIRRIPVKDPRKAALDLLDLCKECGIITAKFTGNLTLHLNQGGLVGTKLEEVNPL